MQRPRRRPAARSSSIADGMAERVVDRLEIVEVDEEDRDSRRSAELSSAARTSLAEQRAVGQPGQRIVVGLVVQLLLQIAQLGDGLLEPVVLERGARVRGERVEQRQVVGA